MPIVYHKGRFDHDIENPQPWNHYWTPVHVGNKKQIANLPGGQYALEGKYGYGEITRWHLDGVHKRVTDEEANDTEYMRTLAKRGYDYVIYRNEYEGHGDSYAVLNYSALYPI